MDGTKFKWKNAKKFKYNNRNLQNRILARFYHLRSVESLNIQEAVAEMLSEKEFSEEEIYSTFRDAKMPSRSNVFAAKELLTRIYNKVIKDEEELNVFGFMILTYGSKEEIRHTALRKFEHFLKENGSPARDANNRRLYYPKWRLQELWKSFTLLHPKYAV